MIYFYPDGSAEDAIGNVNNGVVYVALAGNTGFINTSRAITLWGATGRLRGWHIYSERGTVVLEATVKAESNNAFRPRDQKNPSGFQSD